MREFPLRGYSSGEPVLTGHRARLGSVEWRVPLSDVEVGVDPLPVDLVALDEALEKLAQIDQRQTRLVELRFFAGLTIEETAEMLRIAPATVKRDWALARTWLYRELQGSSG